MYELEQYIDFGLLVRKQKPNLISNMESLLILFLTSFAVINLVHAQNAQGFVSLACGATPPDLVFADKRSALMYTSDTAFVDSGESRRIQKDYEPQTLRQAWYLRSFPSGDRNCYNLNVVRGTRYLVRAVFLYGNYDNRSVYPVFDLHVGPNKWTTVDLKAARNGSAVEILHVPTSDELQVCLVKTGTTTPFISTLELRPLDNGAIDEPEIGNASLFLGNRNYLNNIGVSEYLRFPVDVHDRIWYPYFTPNWNHLTTYREVNTSNNLYRPPKPAMQTAATPRNSSAPLTIWWPYYGPASSMHVFLHFAEIEELKPNETREFNITLNGAHCYGPMRPKAFYAETIHVTSPQECTQGSCLLELIRTSGSTHPPLINAFEVYSILDVRQSGTDPSDVEAVKRLRTFYGLNRASWEGDPCLPTELMWDGLNCTSDDPPTINCLNLSSSGLTGAISPWIQNLTRLEELDLSNNNLTGGVPEFLAAMRSLSIINLSGNMLNGSVPQAILDKANNGLLQLYVQGNPNLRCTSNACKNQVLHKKSNAHRFVIPIVLASVACLFALVAALAIFLLYQERSAHRRGALPRSDKSLKAGRRFSYYDIIRMTNHFDKVVGKGGFGVVYHGCLNENEQVAVKILSEPSARGLKQFKTEVELLLRVHHKNLVHLIGYCDEKDNSALIYEYMANGDLKAQLSGTVKEPRSDSLSWANRVRIATEAAQGLEYLHNGCKPPMVHRDIKTSNILLDENFQAKVADFGLSKSFGDESKSHTSTVVAGTRGYLDPEYRRTGWLTEKSDVYSFGVVLLEMLTNQPVIEDSREGQHIAEWVQDVLAKGDVRDILDPRLRGEFKSTASSVWRVVEVAMSCVNPSSSKRPNMRDVVSQLKECLASETSEHNNGSINVSLALSDEFTPFAR